MACVDQRLSGFRCTDLKIQAEGGTRAFVVVKGVLDGQPVAVFRSCDDLAEGLWRLVEQLREGAIEFKEDKYPTQTQRLLSGE